MADNDQLINTVRKALKVLPRQTARIGFREEEYAKGIAALTELEQRIETMVENNRAAIGRLLDERDELGARVIELSELLVRRTESGDAR